MEQDKNRVSGLEDKIEELEHSGERQRKKY
jgi:hypothetical protein